MSSAAVNEWDNEYARLARIASQVRSSAASPGSPTSSPGAAALPQQLQRLQAQLPSLPISPAEQERRRRLIQHLLGNNVGSSSVVGGAPAGPGSSLQFAMQQQDDMIDELAVGVGRLRDQTQLISEETKMHNRLLGDMEENLDHAHHGLESETRRAARLKEDQSVWRLQLIVAGLSVLLVLLILMGLN